MTGTPNVDDYVSPESLPGAVIDGKYRVDRVIGRGGVGLVVAATHLEMAQRVAIKMIRDDIPMQRELLDRFQREARAAAMIRSEHVARVLDVGRLPTGRPYIVMEYLEGEDLEQVVSRGPLHVTSAVDFALQACEALAEAHRAGIIHRDLKPANLFLTRRSDGAPLIKLLDFGISKIQPLTAIRESRSVETTSIMGSPGYMAPEQMKSTRDVDARADVWSLGAVLYEIVVGRPAFEGSSMLEILNAIAACNPVPPSTLQPGVPPALDLVIRQCLTTDPELRYPGVAELAMALQPFASPAAAVLADRALRISREPLVALEEPQFAAFRSDPRPSALTVITPARRRMSRLRAAVVGLGLLGVAGIAVALFALRSPGASLPNGSGSALAASPPEAPASVAPVSTVPPPPAPSTPATAASPLPSAPSATASAAAGTKPATAAPRRATRPSAPASRPTESFPFGDRK
jgi:serine/threonine protein kinase